MKERKSINVVADQSGSPTYAADLAKVMLKMIESGKWVAGIFNFSNEGVITWHQFAEAIRDLIGSDCTVLAIPFFQLPPLPPGGPTFRFWTKARSKQFTNWRYLSGVAVLKNVYGD